MTSTIATGIKCGNCKAHHPTVHDVRACYGVPPVASGTPSESVSQGRAHEASLPVAATAKQMAFIGRLCEERLLSADAYVGATKQQASAAIERLLAMPKAAPKAHPDAPVRQAAPLTDGMYFKDDVVYKIQKAVHGSGHLYAKRLVPGDGYGSKARFEYAPGAMKVLTLADRMTLEQAKEWGALYGTCCKCGRTLTDEGSIEAGIGPVCAQKGWA